MENRYDEFYIIFKRALEENSIELSEDKIKKFYIFYEELIETNKYLNLTAIIDMEDVIYKHFIDSISIIKIIPSIANNKYKIIDVGTGAGFPGIPLAIAFENLNLLLIDSLNKRLKFIEKIKEKLDLKNVDLLHTRAEEAARDKKFREKFDFAISRAVARLKLLSELCSGFVKVGGKFISYKSEKALEEIDEAKTILSLLNLKLDKIKEVKIKNDEYIRNILIFNKEKTLSTKYPRKMSIIKKENQ